MFDFETNATVTDITQVPEQFRPFYGEDPATKGTFKILSDNPLVKGSVDAITGLNKALKGERKLTADLKAGKVDLAPLAEYGSSPTEIAAGIKTRLDEAQAQVAAGKGVKLDLDKIKADLNSGFAKEKGTLEGTIKSLQAQLENLLVDQAIRGAIGKQGDADLIMPFAKEYVRTVNENGKLRAVVVEADGSAKYSPVTQQPMTMVELVADMKRNPKLARLFDSEAPSGSGAPAGGSAGKVAPVKQGMSSVDKLSAGLKARRI